MKKPIILLFLILLSLSSFAKKDRTDSVITARDYVANKLVYIYLQNTFLNDPKLNNQDRNRINNIVSKLNINLQSYQISNSELGTLLSDNGFPLLEREFVESIYRIKPDILKTDVRKDIPRIIINRVYEIDSRVIQYKKCQDIKEVLVSELDNYFKEPIVVPEPEKKDITEQPNSVDSNWDRAKKHRDSITNSLNKSDSVARLTDSPKKAMATDTTRPVAASIVVDSTAKNTENANSSLPQVAVGGYIGIALLLFLLIAVVIFFRMVKKTSNKKSKVVARKQSTIIQPKPVEQELPVNITTPIKIAETRKEEIKKQMPVDLPTVNVAQPLAKPVNSIPPKEEPEKQIPIEQPLVITATLPLAKTVDTVATPIKQVDKPKDIEIIVGSPKNEEKSTFKATRFYMGAPDKDKGTFQDSFKSYWHKPGITLFEFTLLEPEPAYGGKQFATFKIISDERTIWLLRNNYLSMIGPACESRNEPAINTGAIETEVNGRAVLDRDVWKIKSKAIIVYV